MFQLPPPPQPPVDTDNYLEKLALYYQQLSEYYQKAAQLAATQLSHVKALLPPELEENEEASTVKHHHIELIEESAIALSPLNPPEQSEEGTNSYDYMEINSVPSDSLINNDLELSSWEITNEDRQGTTLYQDKNTEGENLFFPPGPDNSPTAEATPVSLTLSPDIPLVELNLSATVEPLISRTENNGHILHQYHLEFLSFEIEQSLAENIPNPLELQQNEAQEFEALDLGVPIKDNKQIDTAINLELKQEHEDNFTTTELDTHEEFNSQEDRANDLELPLEEDNFTISRQDTSSESNSEDDQAFDLEFPLLEEDNSSLVEANDEEKPPLTDELEDETDVSSQIEDILASHRGKILQIDYIIRKLYGIISGDELSDRKTEVNTILKQGEKDPKWSKMPDAADCWTIDLKEFPDLRATSTINTDRDEEFFSTSAVSEKVKMSTSWILDKLNRFPSRLKKGEHYHTSPQGHYLWTLSGIAVLKKWPTRNRKK